MFTTLQQFRETIVMARKTIKLEKVEYQEHTCSNGHLLHVVTLMRDQRHSYSECNMCGERVVQDEEHRFIACQMEECEDVFCMKCIGCPHGHVLHFAKHRATKVREARAPRRCQRCAKTTTFDDLFLHCRPCNKSFCYGGCEKPTPGQ